jgi:hypothetical protein
LPHALPPELVQALRTTARAQHTALDDTNSTAILDDGSLGKGVRDVAWNGLRTTIRAPRSPATTAMSAVSGSTTSAASYSVMTARKCAATTSFCAKGRKKIREAAPFAMPFHLAPGIEATATADGMGAILRPPGAPPWNFRCRGAMLSIEESLSSYGPRQSADRSGVVGEVSALGGGSTPGSSAVHS